MKIEFLSKCMTYLILTLSELKNCLQVPINIKAKTKIGSKRGENNY